MSYLGNVARGGKAVTTSDTVELTGINGSIYVGGTGDVRVLTHANDDLTFFAFPAGQILPVRVKKVFTTNTTATLMIGLTA